VAAGVGVVAAVAGTAVAARRSRGAAGGVALLAVSAGAAVALRRRRRNRPPSRKLPRATPVTGNARVLGPEDEGRVLRALAGWTPPPPRTPVGRLAAYAWAAPMTAAGLVLVAVSGAGVRIEDGVLLVRGARGPVGLYLRRRGFAATAWGHVILSAPTSLSPGLLAHELVHVRQAERLGALFAPLYLVLLARYGYARHPMERAARLGGRRAGGAPA